MLQVQSKCTLQQHLFSGGVFQFLSFLLLESFFFSIGFSQHPFFFSSFSTIHRSRRRQSFYPRNSNRASRIQCIGSWLFPYCLPSFPSAIGIQDTNGKAGDHNGSPQGLNHDRNKLTHLPFYIVGICHISF